LVVPVAGCADAVPAAVPTPTRQTARSGVAGVARGAGFAAP